MGLMWTNEQRGLFLLVLLSHRVKMVSTVIEHIHFLACKLSKRLQLKLLRWFAVAIKLGI